MNKENYDKCTNYFEDRVFGIYTYFERGYLTLAAFAIMDMLRFIDDHEPLCFYDERLINFSKVVGIKLPPSLDEFSDWKQKYLNVLSIAEDLKKTYNKSILKR